MLGYPTDDAGHVVARALGGPGTFQFNIFPQLPRINRGQFRVWEQSIAAEIRATNQPAVIAVKFSYSSANATRPDRIYYFVRIGDRVTMRVFGN